MKLRDLFRKKLKADNLGLSMVVQYINPKTTKVHEGLGITEERLAEIGSFVRKHFYSSNDLVEVGRLISIECKHTNELFMSYLILGRYINDNNSPIAALFGSLNKKD